jgi:hypothetical protein
MEAFFHHRFQASAESERGLSGSGATAERDDSDTFIEQEIECDALFSRAAMKSEGLAVTPN